MIIRPITASVAKIEAMVPASIESLPSSALTVRSSITFSFTGSLPEARLTASWLALSTVKLPLICARPPRIGSLMFGADSTLSSRMIANGLPTFSCVTRPKRRAPAALKVMSTTARPSWSKPCLASTSCSPDTITRRWTAIAPVPSAIGSTWLPGGARPCGDLVRVGVQVDQLEFEPRGLADQLLQRFGILDARDLDEDPPLALVDDRDFLGSARIDPAADDVAGDGQRVLERLLGARFGRGQDDAVRHRPTLTSQSRVPVRPDRLGQRPQPLDRGVELGRIANDEAQPPAGGRHVADLDARLAAAKLGRDLLFHRLQPLLGGVGDIGFEQQLAAAGDVEAEVDARARQPSRPALDLVLGKQARNGQQDADKNGERDRPDLPAGEIEHFGPLVVGRLGSVGSTTWVSVDLTAWTRMPWAELHLDFGVADLGDLADQPAAGDDAVALLDRGDLRLMLLHPLLLRADQQEPEDDEDQDQRDGLDEEAGAGRRRGRCGEKGNVGHGPGNLFIESAPGNAPSAGSGAAAYHAAGRLAKRCASP